MIEVAAFVEYLLGIEAVQVANWRDLGCQLGSCLFLGPSFEEQVPPPTMPSFLSPPTFQVEQLGP